MNGEEVLRSRIIGHGEEAPDQLLAHPLNFRRHPGEQLEALRGSMRSLGWIKTVIVNQTTGHVIDGHARVEEALRQGLSSVPVTYVDISEDEERMALAVLDPISAMAVQDDAVLRDLLEGLTAEDPAMAAFLASLRADAGVLPATGILPGTDLDDAPALPATAITQPGEIIQLGPHRLVCGRAEDGAVWDALMGDGHAEMLWTDPPYGVSYVGKTANALTIQNDGGDMDQLYALLGVVFAGRALDRSKKGAPWYICAPHGPQFLAFARVLTEIKVWRQTLVWVKDRFVLGRSDYHYQHEAIFHGETPGSDDGAGIPAPLVDPVEPKDATPIFYGWPPGAPHVWHGGRKRTTVLEYPRPSRSAEHPTMKPVALIEDCLTASSKMGALVVDCFAGSGSTVMACQATGRVARLIELDPRYCDVIIDRWVGATGGQVVRVGRIA